MVPLSPIGSQEMIRIVTAHKRRLGQGNIFTPVCQSFCSWGKVYPSMQWAGGVCIPAWNGLGCVCVTRGICGHGGLTRGVCYQGMWPRVCDHGGVTGVCDQGVYTPSWSTSERYASYWNALLFLCLSEQHQQLQPILALINSKQMKWFYRCCNFSAQCHDRCHWKVHQSQLPSVVEPYYHPRYAGRKPHTNLSQSVTNTSVKLTNIAELKKDH